MRRKHWGDYATLATLLVALCISETLPPFERRIYHKSSPGDPSDIELWRYSMPLKKDTVPPWAVPMIALLFPASFFGAYYFIYKCERKQPTASAGAVCCA